MTQEQLEKKLTSEYYGTSGNLTLEWINENENGFSRELQITTENGFIFVILWYHNLLTIQIPNGISVWADEIYLSSAMPHNSILDVRTKFKNVDSGFCIRIREYDGSQ